MDRSELKTRAKEALKRNYWPCVLVAAILLLLVGTTTVTISNKTSGTTQQQMNIEYNGEEVPINEVFNDNPEVLGIIIGALIVIITIVILVSSIADIFIMNPLEVGCKGFFAINTEAKPEISEIGSGFRYNYPRNVKAMFLVGLYTFLWSLLLIVPGIIKSISYSMVPYILAEDPDISVKDALAKSVAMTDGHKMELFVLDLSFIGWRILEGISLFVAGILFVEPYVQCTKAEVYKDLKAQIAEIDPA